MKTNLTIISFILCSLLFSQDYEISIKDYKENGKLNAMIKDYDDQLYLVQIDVLNDSLLNNVLSSLPNIDFNAGPSTYHRLLHKTDFNRLQNILTKDYYKVLDQNYKAPETRDYWTFTLQGNQYSSTSGETNGSCMCLDSSDCVVVGYNDSWYNPFDYYGEASWSFVPPEYDEILEARIYIAGAQCDDLPIWSETTMSVKNNDCSWSDFQATLSIDSTVNGPYVITDDLVNNIWCDGALQPVVGSEDNYNVDWVQVEIYYTCNVENSPNNFVASNNEFCDYVNLNWLNDADIDGYKLYRDGQLIINLEANENNYLDYFAENNIEHEYCLTALNECGESLPVCVTGSRKSEPNQIEDLSVSNEYVDYILINWSPSSNAGYYNLFRDGFLLSMISGNQELVYQDMFVEQGINYEYCIESTNDCGESDWVCALGTLAVGSVGDINLDSQVDVLDIIILLNFVLELDIPQGDQIWLADINQDQILNILDIVTLVSMILEQ